MPVKALVVDANPARVAQITRALSSYGCETSEANTFERAVAAAGATVFDVIITAVRLGAYNGLHLILRTQRPGTTAIVTTPTPDAVLEIEAQRLGAVCLAAPWEDPSEMLAHVARARSIEQT